MAFYCFHIKNKMNKLTIGFDIYSSDVGFGENIYPVSSHFIISLILIPFTNVTHLLIFIHLYADQNFPEYFYDFPY